MTAVGNLAKDPRIQAENDRNLSDNGNSVVGVDVLGDPQISTRTETKASTSQTLAAASFRRHFLGLACKAERTAKFNERLSLRPRGEVASVQDEHRIFDYFDTDDGRGVLSARELSDSYS